MVAQVAHDREFRAVDRVIPQSDQSVVGLTPEGDEVAVGLVTMTSALLDHQFANPC